MEIKEKIFSRVYSFPSRLLPLEIRAKKGARNLVYTLSRESNGWAIWKQLITWEYAHSDEPETQLWLVQFHYDTYKYKDDFIEETLLAFKKEVEEIESLYE